MNGLTATLASCNAGLKRASFRSTWLFSFSFRRSHQYVEAFRALLAVQDSQQDCQFVNVTISRDTSNKASRAARKVQASMSLHAYVELASSEPDRARTVTESVNLKNHYRVGATAASKRTEIFEI